LREFFKDTAELSLDSNNRMLIPRRLLDEAAIDKEAILAGQFGKIEIWAKEKYETSGLGDEEFASLADKILGGSLNNEE
jgi:MraZ protein